MSTSIATIASTSTALGRLDKALKVLTPLGLHTADTSSTTAIVGLVKELEAIDQTRALILARTLQQGPVFNEAVRSQVADMSFGTRHESITELFNSIITDMQVMANRIEHNQNGLKDKASFWMMRLTRGTVHKRFGKIRDLYVAVQKDTKEQLDREAAILNAYLDYRGAVKEAEIAGVQMLKTQQGKLEAAQQALAAAQTAATSETEPEAKSRAQLARDDAQRAFDTENRRYDLIKAISESLTIEYNTSEVVMTDLSQTRAVKDAVLVKSVAFFPAADTILSSLSANLTSKQGLAEAARSVDAMSAGINRGLEAAAESGRQVKLEAIKTAHGATIKAASVQKLLDAVITFQADATKAVAEQRKLATEEAQAISKLVEEGKDRFVAIASQTTTTNG